MEVAILFVAVCLLAVIVAVATHSHERQVSARRGGAVAVDDPATDRQRRYIGHLVRERRIQNPPDQYSPSLTKTAASALIEELLSIPTDRGEFDRDGDTPIAAWWRSLPMRERIAWILDKRRDECMQRTDIYDAVRDDHTPGRIRSQNREIRDVVDVMLREKQLRSRGDYGGYCLTASGDTLVPTTPGAVRR